MGDLAPTRFVLEAVADGGLLLDLRSGLLFDLNTTAALVWKQALAGQSPDQIASGVAATFDVSLVAARHDVDATLAVPTEHAFPPRLTDCRYEPSPGGGYTFSMGDIPVLEIAPAGQALRKLPGFQSEQANVYLRTIAPKLVALLGTSVLHASAVRRPSDGTMVAFMGASGAGKTTTARAFARSGWEPVCEDKLVVRLEGQQPRAVLGGEARILHWIARTRERLMTAGADAWCEAVSLGGTWAGPTVPIDGIMLVDSLRRRGTELRTRDVGQCAAAGQVFRHAFYGSHSPEEWRRQVAMAVAVARTATIREATMPDGLTALTAAVRVYTEMMAS